MNIFKKLRSFAESFVSILFGVGIFAYFAFMLNMLQPILSVLATLLFVVFGTLIGFRKKENAILTILGLGIYILSWYIPYESSNIIPVFVCGAGILTWLFGAFFSIPTMMLSKREVLL